MGIDKFLGMSYGLKNDVFSGMHTSYSTIYSNCLYTFFTALTM